MFSTIKNRALEAAKAVVAVATPIITAAVVDIFAELQKGALVALAAGTTGLTVYLTRNRPKGA